MTIIEKTAFRARVTYRCRQSGLTRDARIKKFWDDLADNWIALEGALVVRDVRGKIIPLV